MSLSPRKLFEEQVQQAIDKCWREYPELAEAFELQSADFLEQHSYTTSKESYEAQVAWGNLMNQHRAQCGSFQAQRGHELLTRQARQQFENKKQC